jgi:hypothetical protein
LAQGTDRAEAKPLAFLLRKKYQKIVRAAGGGKEDEGLVALVTDCQKKIGSEFWRIWLFPKIGRSELGAKKATKSDPTAVLKKDAGANFFEKKIVYPGVFERVGSAFP